MDNPPLLLALDDGLGDHAALWHLLEHTEGLRIARTGDRAAAEGLIAAGSCGALLASLDASGYPWEELLAAAQRCSPRLPAVLLARADAAEPAVAAMRRGAHDVVFTTPGYPERALAALTEALSRPPADRARAPQDTRLSLLAKISAAFAAASLDYTAALDTVARHIAEAVDGLCGVLLLSDDRQWFDSVVTRHSDPRIQHLASGAMRLLRLPAGGRLRSHILERGEALAIEELAAAELSPALALAFGEYERYAGPSSLLLAQLRAHGVVLGAVLVLRARRPGLADDLAFLQELADRAAITITAAREHHAAQQELAARAQAEEALRRREQMFRALVENSPDGIFRLDTALRIVYANPQTLAILERDLEQVIGRSCEQIGLPDDIAGALVSAAAFVLGNRQEAIYTAEVLDDRRGAFAYHIRLHPEFAPDGAVESILGIFRDITRLHRSQEQVAQLNRTLEDRVQERTAALRASEARLQFLLAHTPAVIFTLRIADNSMAFLSEAMRDLLGYEAWQFSTVQFWLEHVHADDLAHLHDGYAELMGKGQHTAEYRFRHADGGYRWLQSGTQLVRDEDGAPSELIGYVVDISARKEAEGALRQAISELSIANAELARTARLKDEFLASMSHELRTPLNAILGRAETLQEQIHGPLNQRQLHAVRSIEESGRLLLSLINDILDLSKIEAGRLELSLMPVAIDQLCQSTLRMVAQTAARRRISITSHVERRLPHVVADERRLKQVLVNLLANALKFTPDGGAVGIEAARDKEAGELRLAVWDTGIGIAAADLPRLFQPFVQLDSSLSRRYNGSGLGLALVARMVALHGGRVWAESKPGRGSRFTVALPLHTAEPAAGASVDRARVTGAPGEPAPAATAAPRILIADDNAENVQVLQEYIGRHGFSVVTASNGHEAVALSAEQPPALILMDIQMPDMDGLEAIAHVRADPRTAGVPIIALTALAMPGDRERCLHAGATDYLSKPVSLRDLLKTVRWHLGVHQEK